MITLLRSYSKPYCKPSNAAFPGRQNGVNESLGLQAVNKNCENIPHSRQNPKSFGLDAEVVGDRIAKASPVLGDFVAQEIERGVRELSACGVAFVVRDIPVH
jgi:hypothetical protein